MAKRQPKEPGELGRRILAALKDANMSPTALERTLIERSEASGSEVRWSQGYMSRLISGERGGTAIDPLKIQDIADQLGVRFEWLATGREPMREGSEQTPQETGFAMARMLGGREDAIDHVRVTVPDTGQDARYWYDLAMHESDARKRAGHSEFPATERSKIRKKAVEARKVPPPAKDPEVTQERVRPPGRAHG